MATVTPTLSLVSADALVDKLNLSVTDRLTITGQAVYGSAAMATGSDFTIAAASYTNAYVYLKNMSTDSSARSGGSTEAMDVELGSVNLMLLGPGEFAFFPWTSETDINILSVAGTPTLEYAIFEA